MQEKGKQGHRMEFIVFISIFDYHFPAFNWIMIALDPKYSSIIARGIEGFDKIK